MEDWDLHAVVRGCCTSSFASTSTIATTAINPTCGGGGVDFTWFPPLDLVQENERSGFSSFSSTFPDLFESRTAAALEDLEQLCKPFIHSPPPVNLTNPNTTTNTDSSILPPPLFQNPKTELTSGSLISPTPSTSTSTPRPKRRKNQQKRVVCQVPAEGLSSDMWAWRKYGQKPIKGSPYPRGYFRCSSSKGCLARKQVERSRSDPSMFIITYTAEHNHPVPTHRNSLAGSTRNKVSSSAQRITNSDGTTITTTTTTTTTTTSKPSCSSSSPLTGLSPTTPLSIEDLLMQQKEEEEEIDQDDGDDLLHIPEGCCDDLFMDFEEFTDPTGAPPSATNPTTTTSDQFQMNFPWITS